MRERHSGHRGGEYNMACLCTCHTMYGIHCTMYNDGIARDETAKKMDQILGPLKWHARNLGLYPENNREH